MWVSFCAESRGTKVCSFHLVRPIHVLIIRRSDSTKERFLSTYHIPEFTLPSSLPIPPHYHLYLTSSEYLPMSTSTSYAHASKDTLLLASPNRYSSHRRSQSQSSSKSAWTKSPSNRPNPHAAGPLNSPAVRLDPNAAIFPSLNSSILALLAAHTKGRTKDFPFFNATVLELVKLVQAGLSLFGMYDVRERFNSTSGCFLFDGLLCDVTVQGIERWITEIGEPRACLEVCLSRDYAAPISHVYSSLRNE